MELPVTCTLGEDDFNNRVDSVKTLLSESRAVVSRGQQAIKVCFEDPPAGLVAEVGKWLEKERCCCSFVGFRLTVEPGNGPVVVEIVGSSEALDFFQPLLT